MKRVKVQKTQSGKETLGTLPVLGFAQRTCDASGLSGKDQCFKQTPLFELTSRERVQTAMWDAEELCCTEAPRPVLTCF